MGELNEHLRIAAFALPIVLLAFALHEMAHAYVATWFGDPTPERHGRRTLNPIRHLDPIGTLMIVGSMILFGFPFGFAVTPVDDNRMRRPRLHGALTALAGPMVNLLFTIAFAALLVYAVHHVGPDSYRLGNAPAPLLYEVALYGMVFNAFLVVFNLLPIPPLDGGRIVGAFMGDELRREWRKIDEYGMFIVLGLVFLGGASFTEFLQTLQTHLLRLVEIITGLDIIG
ncbi:MAG: site-2 protease family protein [Thermoleophilia bacterium]|nr:site-2 protease family protein [Thermoleophilia bacterium]